MDKFLDLLGILYGCPVGNRSEHCPVNDVDHLSFHDKMTWFEELSYADKIKIQKHHQVCSAKRDKNSSLYKE